MRQKFSGRTLRSWLPLLVLCAAATLARATTVIFPVEAIDDLWQLPSDDFKLKYGGINITGLGPSDEGWYVRYRHENLTYMFGPLADSDAAQKKKWDLEAVRDAAIRNRPSLSTSKVDYVKFTYSGVYGKAGNTPYKGKKGDGKGGSGSGDDKDGTGTGAGGDKDGSGSGKDGTDAGKDGSGTGGDGTGDKLAGGDGTGDQSGGDGTGDQAGGGKDGKGGKGGKGSKAGKSGSGADGSGDGSGDDNDPNGVVGAGKGGLQKVASLGNGQ